eukprot:gene25558-24601_t
MYKYPDRWYMCLCQLEYSTLKREQLHGGSTGCVALANLRPPVVDEMDSFMYQTVGHEAIELIAQAMELPLIRRDIVGGSVAVDMGYTKTDGDEVEDLYMLLQDVLASDNS